MRFFSQNTNKVSNGSNPYFPGVYLDDNVSGALVYGNGTGNVFFRYTETENGDGLGYINIRQIASLLVSHTQSINDALAKAENNKVKSVAVTDSGIADDVLDSSFDLAPYKYVGQTSGVPVKNKVDELMQAGHTILGGFLVRGPFTDQNWADNVAGFDCMYICHNKYYTVPYQVSFYALAYLTGRVEIAILYI